MMAGLDEKHGYDYGSFGAIFTLEINLTLDGLAVYEDIVGIVFQFLHMMQASPLPAWIFEEQKAMAEVNFRFHEEDNAIEQCEQLAVLMQVDALPPLVDTPYQNDMLGHVSRSTQRALDVRRAHGRV